MDQWCHSVELEYTKKQPSVNREPLKQGDVSIIIRAGVRRALRECSKKLGPFLIIHGNLREAEKAYADTLQA